MPRSVTVYLVRHAQSRPTADVRHCAWPLSDVGKDQAARLPAALAPLGVEEIHSSPYLRCVDTVQPFATSAALTVNICDDLRERLITPGWRDDFMQLWRRSWADFSFTLPDCESSLVAQERMVAAVHTTCARTSASTLALSSHGNVISLLLNHIDDSFGIDDASAVRNPDVFRLVWRDGSLAWDRDFCAIGLDEYATRQS